MIAGIIYLIAGLLIVTVSAVDGGIGLVCGVVMIVGSVIMNSENRSRIRTGAILVLVFTIIGALYTLVGLIGFVLGVVGSIIGLVWKPTAPTQTPTPPASTV